MTIIGPDLKSVDVPSNVGRAVLMPNDFRATKMDGRLMVDASLVMELLDAGQWCYQNVHTHTPGKDGRVKLHFPLKIKSTLREFFDSWGRSELLDGAKARVSDKDFDNPGDIVLVDDLAIVLFLGKPYEPRSN